MGLSAHAAGQRPVEELTPRPRAEEPRAQVPLQLAEAGGVRLEGQDPRLAEKIQISLPMGFGSRIRGLVWIGKWMPMFFRETRVG